jgi:2-haloacid dehalogenase
MQNNQPGTDDIKTGNGSPLQHLNHLWTYALDAYMTLDAFPDARAALRDLKARGEQTAILSNGSPAMLEAAVNAARIKDQLDAVLSVHTIRMYKPRPEVYALVTRTFACKPADVVFVSSNRWDVMGASAFGFRTAWINRANLPDEYAGLPPPVVLSDLIGLAARTW